MLGHVHPTPRMSAHLAKQIVRWANASGLSLAGSRSSVLTCLERAWGWEGREEVPFGSCSRSVCRGREWGEAAQTQPGSRSQALQTVLSGLDVTLKAIRRT